MGSDAEPRAGFARVDSDANTGPPGFRGSSARTVRPVLSLTPVLPSHVWPPHRLSKRPDVAFQSAASDTMYGRSVSSRDWNCSSRCVLYVPAPHGAQTPPTGPV